MACQYDEVNYQCRPQGPPRPSELAALVAGSHRYRTPGAWQFIGRSTSATCTTGSSRCRSPARSAPPRHAASEQGGGHDGSRPIRMPTTSGSYPPYVSASRMPNRSRRRRGAVAESLGQLGPRPPWHFLALYRKPGNNSFSQRKNPRHARWTDLPGDVPGGPEGGGPGFRNGLYSALAHVTPTPGDAIPDLLQALRTESGMRTLRGPGPRSERRGGISRNCSTAAR